jgi:hypothetical protein
MADFNREDAESTDAVDYPNRNFNSLHLTDFLETFAVQKGLRSWEYTL